MRVFPGKQDLPEQTLRQIRSICPMTYTLLQNFIHLPTESIIIAAKVLQIRIVVLIFRKQRCRQMQQFCILLVQAVLNRAAAQTKQCIVRHLLTAVFTHLLHRLRKASCVDQNADQNLAIFLTHTEICLQSAQQIQIRLLLLSQTVQNIVDQLSLVQRSQDLRRRFSKKDLLRKRGFLILPEDTTALRQPAHRMCGV